MTRGTAVAVWRRTQSGVEWLVVHRSHFAPEFAGDWAWGPPAGGCEAAELLELCARRELREETSIEAHCVRTDCGASDFTVFHAEVPLDAEVQLSWEHDGYRWLPLNEARELCLPRYVGDQLACVAALVGAR